MQCEFSQEELYGNRNRTVVEEVVVSDGFIPAFLCIKCGQEVTRHLSEFREKDRYEEEEKNDDSE